MVAKSPLENRFLAKIHAQRSYPLVIAHRGDSFHAPENTLEAIALSHAKGADACEIDVQLTRDGAVIVIHDESLSRTTNVATVFTGDSRIKAGCFVRDFDLNEIQSLDAGAWFLDDPPPQRSAGDFGTTDRITPEQARHFRSGMVRIPQLADVLNLVVRLDWLVNVEIKVVQAQQRNQLIDLVLNQIMSCEAADRVLISSFDETTVRKASGTHFPFAVGFLTRTAIPDAAPYVRDHLGSHVYHPSMEALGAPRELGIPVLVYTVNDASPGGLVERLAAWPVDGLFTDDPEALVARFRKEFEPRAWPWRSRPSLDGSP